MWYGALDTFQVGRSNLEQPLYFGLILAIKRAIFGPPPAIDRCTERPNKVPHHLSYVWGRFRTPEVPVSIVTVTAVWKRWWKWAKKAWKSAILWLPGSHRRYMMATKIFQYWYLVPHVFWFNFRHFRVSRSIVSTQTLHSSTGVFRVPGSFVNLYCFLLLCICSPENSSRPQVQWRLQNCGRRKK